MAKKSKIDKLYDAKPAKPRSQEEDSAFLTLARERARDGASYWGEIWKQAEDDLHFLHIDQWPGNVRSERELEQRPCLTNNVLPTFIDQVLGDILQNRPSIKVIGVELPDVDTGEKRETLKVSNISGSQDYELAEVFTGIIRNIEYRSDAETSYDIGITSVLESGLGFLRILNDFENEENFDQELKIAHVENQFSVTMDPGAKERDYHDMGWCFIDDQMLKTDFQEKYPGAATDPVNGNSVESLGTWYSEKTVRISEYLIRKPVIREVVLLSDGKSVFLDEIEPIVDELLKAGTRIVRTRKVKTFKVFWYKITGLDILEGPREIPCSSIPVTPIWGKFSTVKDKKIIKSKIRESKDAQRMANYFDSSAVETRALAPKAPFTGSEEHIEGYEEDWKQSNTKNFGLLKYVAQFQGDPGPQRQQPAHVPSADLALSMANTDKIKATMGMYDASLGQQGNETSGRMVESRKMQGDRGNFIFADNLNKALYRIGKNLIEMIPRTIDTERVQRLGFEDGTDDFVKLNEQVLDEDTNEYVTINDLSVGKFDLVVTAGPSHATQRQEAAESLFQFAKAVPSAAAAISDLIAANMDWPMADKIAERLKKLIPPHILTGEEREKLQEDQPEPPPPTAEQQIEMGELDARKLEASANTKKSEATIAKAESDVVQEQLKTEQAKLRLQEMEAKATAGSVPFQQVRELVAEALAEIAAQK